MRPALPKPALPSRPIFLLLGLAASCVGSIDADSPETGGTVPPPPNHPVDPSKITNPKEGAARQLASVTGLRRLTIEEYDNTITDLVGDTSRRGGSLLPADIRKPFDDTVEQDKQISDNLVLNVELLARDIAASLMRDVSRRDRIIGCRSTEADCLKSFVTSFGQRALRRPLTDAEIQIFLRLPAATK